MKRVYDMNERERCEWGGDDLLEREERELMDILAKAGIEDKEMPYTHPSKEFFEQISANALSVVERGRVRRITLRRLTVAVASVAAMIAVALFIATPEREQGDMLERFDVSLDNYVASLSDDELNALLYDMESGSEFYTNL